MFFETCTGVCYNDYVLGDPSFYDTAYFEVAYVRVYGQPGELTVIQASSGRRSTGLRGHTGLLPLLLAGLGGLVLWVL